ncbi:hypothetical protein QFC20_004786 [Naganishia adeliensis]|uniref:Uncharacterized protein n=1 Tax=Naganishia adeliensis TaxID=92952 RepID=A0ACC2VW15_9TREE|nr:hypothetical protein QFC20_004786 [Naganishia adeliensis]
MLSTAGSSPFSNSRRPTLAQPPRTHYNPAIWHPAAIVPARRQIVPHHSAAPQCRQEQGWIEEFQSRTRTAQTQRPLSSAQHYPTPPRINPHHSYHPASMSQSRSTHDEAGNIGNVTGAEEVAVAPTGGKDTKGKAGKGKGTQPDESLEKGGFGAIAGAEEVKAKL